MISCKFFCKPFIEECNNADHIRAFEKTGSFVYIKWFVISLTKRQSFVGADRLVGTAPNKKSFSCIRATKYHFVTLEILTSPSIRGVMKMPACCEVENVNVNNVLL